MNDNPRDEHDVAHVAHQIQASSPLYNVQESYTCVRSPPAALYVLLERYCSYASDPWDTYRPWQTSSSRGNHHQGKKPS